MTQQEHKTVFISYRRKVASYIAHSIFQDLRANGYDVFMDVETIDSGLFKPIILSQIEARAHFLVVLTPGTLKRCEEPGDWLRREIEYAMETQRNIVPLLVNDFKFNKRNQKYLTGELAKLNGLNGVTVPHEYFEAAMEKLRERFLKLPVYVITTIPQGAEKNEAERKIEEAVAQPTPTQQELNAEDYLNMGLALNDNSDEEIIYYTEAISLHSQYAEAYNNRGAAYAAQGNLDAAIADFNEAIRLDPRFANAYYNRGRAHQVQGDLEGAIADYSEAIRFDPQYAEAYNNRGWVRRDKGDLDGAIADYNEAIRVAPQYVNAHYNRATVLERKGDFEGAIADYQHYLDLGGGERDGDQEEVEQIIRELKEKLK